MAPCQRISSAGNAMTDAAGRGTRLDKQIVGVHMKTTRRSLASHLALGALAMGLATAASSGMAAPTFYGTDPVSVSALAWQVDANTTGVDGTAAFKSDDFVTATTVTALGRTNWIANNADGSNGGIGAWTYFTFQQTFDVTAAQITAGDVLTFEWAADDSGKGHDERGSWAPTFSLNGGAQVAGVWNTTDESYVFGVPTTVSGFVQGDNTLTFYVEGNGQTDGMSLKVLSFAPAVPEPGSLSLLAAGLGLLGVTARRAKRNAS